MFYKYDESLREEKPKKKKGLDLFEILFIGIFIISFLVVYKQDGLSIELLKGIAMLPILLIFGRLIEKGNRGIGMGLRLANEDKLAKELEVVKEKYETLGIELKLDCMHIRGFCEVQTKKGHDYFVEKTIFYKDIVSLAKTERTTWVYYNDWEKNDRVGLLINRHFENSDELFNELKLRTGLK